MAFYLDVKPPVGPVVGASLAEALPDELKDSSDSWDIDRVTLGDDTERQTTFSVRFKNRDGNREGTPPQLDDADFVSFLTGSARALINLSGTIRYVGDPVVQSFEPISVTDREEEIRRHQMAKLQKWEEERPAREAEKRRRQAVAEEYDRTHPKVEPYFDPRGY